MGEESCVYGSNFAQVTDESRSQATWKEENEASDWIATNWFSVVSCVREKDSCMKRCFL